MRVSVALRSTIHQHFYSAVIGHRSNRNFTDLAKKASLSYVTKTHNPHIKLILSTCSCDWQQKWLQTQCWKTAVPLYLKKKLRSLHFTIALCCYFGCYRCQFCISSLYCLTDLKKMSLMDSKWLPGIYNSQQLIIQNQLGLSKHLPTSNKMNTTE